MIIKNATVKGELVNIVVKEGKISEVCASGVMPLGCENDSEILDACGKKVIPGLIDVHTHGICGYDTMDANFKALAESYAARGTTAWLPTTMTMSTESLVNVCDSSAEYSGKGATLLGVHLEGPYIALSKKGAQNEAYIKKPSAEEFSKFKNVKMITLAPEVEGAMSFIRNVAENTDCIVSLGHTDCTCKIALEAIEAGANCLTHTFNAMPPLHHREPGPIGAAAEKNIYAQLICDGIHVSKQVVLAAYRIFGPERLVLISDSLCCACLPDGRYESGGLPVKLEGGCAKLLDGTIAGSSVSLLDCVKKAVEFGIPFDDAVAMASSTPAEMLKITKGKIKAGYDADLLVIDDNFNLETIVIGGTVYGE